MRVTIGQEINKDKKALEENEIRVRKWRHLILSSQEHRMFFSLLCFRLVHFNLFLNLVLHLPMGHTYYNWDITNLLYDTRAINMSSCYVPEKPCMFFETSILVDSWGLFSGWYSSHKVFAWHPSLWERVFLHISKKSWLLCIITIDIVIIIVHPVQFALF